MEESIRVVERSEVSHLYLKDEFEMIDPDLEKALPAKDLLGLGIYKIDPHIATKYRLLAELIAFFEKWREEALEYRQLFAEIHQHLKQFALKFDDLEFLQY